MRPVCQSENSILSDSESKCYLVDKNTNKVKKRQKWESNLCQDKQDWSTARYVTRLRMLQVGAGRRKCMDASEIHKFSTIAVKEFTHFVQF